MVPSLKYVTRLIIPFVCTIAQAQAFASRSSEINSPVDPNI